MVCDPVECERETWTFGVAGRCDNVTNRCVCPEGYTGRDLWESFESCQVSVSVAEIGALVELVAVEVTALSLFFLVVYLVVEWGIHHDVIRTCREATQTRDLRKMSIRHTLTSSIDQSALRATMSHRQQQGINTKMRYLVSRQMLILSVLLCMFMYAIFLIPGAAAGTEKPPVYRYDIPYAGDFMLAISIAFLYSGFFLMSYVYYISLPDLEPISKLFNIKSMFFSKKHLIPRLVIGSCIFVSFYAIVTLAIIPSAHFDDAAIRAQSGSAFLVGTVLIALVFVVFFNGICRISFKVYTEALLLIEANGSHNAISTKKLRRAISNIRYIKVALPFGVPFLLIPTIIMLTYDGRRHLFIIHPILVVGAAFSALIVCFIFAREILTKPQVDDAQKDDDMNIINWHSYSSSKSV